MSDTAELTLLVNYPVPSSLPADGFGSHGGSVTHTFLMTGTLVAGGAMDTWVEPTTPGTTQAHGPIVAGTAVQRRQLT